MSVSTPKMMDQLRQNRWAVSVFRTLNDVRHGRGHGGFHRDAIYKQLIRELLDSAPVTSFVETGTYHGYSTEMVALQSPKLPIYTTEVVEQTFRIAQMRLAKYRNVVQKLGSSDQVVKDLIESGGLGDLPMFYLDAHWQKYWPLREELSRIGEARLRAMIVIDDFEVPGQPQFQYDIDGGARNGAGEKCNLDYIRPSLKAPNVFHCALPRYGQIDAFGHNKGLQRNRTRGHLVLFQNLPDEFAAFMKRPFARKYYFEHPAAGEAAQSG